MQHCDVTTISFISTRPTDDEIYAKALVFAAACKWSRWKSPFQVYGKRQHFSFVILIKISRHRRFKIQYWPRDFSSRRLNAVQTQNPFYKSSTFKKKNKKKWRMNICHEFIFCHAIYIFYGFRWGRLLRGLESIFRSVDFYDSRTSVLASGPVRRKMLKRVNPALVHSSVTSRSFRKEKRKEEQKSISVVIRSYGLISFLIRKKAKESEAYLIRTSTCT